MSSDVQPVDLSTENSGPPSVAASGPLNADCWESLIESTDVFYKSLTLGRVRGVVAVLDFPDSGTGERTDLVRLIRELINRDILVTLFRGEIADMIHAEIPGADFAGATGDGLAELCEFIGIHPVMYSDRAADESALMDFYHGLAQRAVVGIADLPVAVIATGLDQAEISGTLFTMEDDAEKTADRIDQHIHDKRIDARWCDRCGGRFSPFS